MREPITLTHSTWVEDNGKPVKVLVYPEHIFSVMYMPASKAVAVQSIAGAYVTVLESKETVAELIRSGNNKPAIAGGENNE
jgi:hypothetical protein